MNNKEVNFKPIIIGLTIILFLSCAPFSKSDFKDNFLKSSNENLSKINGKFKLHYKKRFGEKNTNNVLVSSYPLNLPSILLNANISVLKDGCIVQLTFENREKLHLKVIENQEKVFDTILSGKLKNGMFYLSNKEYTPKGIPFLFGGHKLEERRIGLTKNNNLIVNVAGKDMEHFLIFFGGGYQYNYAVEYERIQ